MAHLLQYSDQTMENLLVNSKFQCECAWDDHAAALEPKHSQTGLMCDMALSCDSEELDT